ncbi:MAG TPA: hypothetical protein VIZ43_10915 [Trebonia sp.]
MITSPARRVATFDDLERAGDYTGPHLVRGYPEGERPNVWFLLPVHTGPDMFGDGQQGSGLHGVTSPPWTFRECPDGSLEIRASIGCGPQPYYWHGYLDEGNIWRQV